MNSGSDAYIKGRNFLVLILRTFRHTINSVKFVENHCEIKNLGFLKVYDVGTQKKHIWTTIVTAMGLKIRVSHMKKSSQNWQYWNIDHLPQNLMQDDHNWRPPQWKKTSMKHNQDFAHCEGSGKMFMWKKLWVKVNLQFFHLHWIAPSNITKNLSKYLVNLNLFQIEPFSTAHCDPQSTINEPKRRLTNLQLFYFKRCRFYNTNQPKSTAYSVWPIPGMRRYIDTGSSISVSLWLYSICISKKTRDTVYPYRVLYKKSKHPCISVSVESSSSFTERSS